MTTNPVDFNVPKEYAISEANFRLLLIFREQLSTATRKRVTIKETVEFILEDFLKSFYYQVRNGE